LIAGKDDGRLGRDDLFRPFTNDAEGFLMGLHNDWKTLKAQLGKFKKDLPTDNFGGDLDAFEKAEADFVKKCNELDAQYDKLLAARKAAGEKMGTYGTALSKDKAFNDVHGNEWLKFVSSLKKPMIHAGTRFNDLVKKCEAQLKKMAGL
jgi:hypothetical protein